MDGCLGQRANPFSEEAGRWVHLGQPRAKILEVPQRKATCIPGHAGGGVVCLVLHSIVHWWNCTLRCEDYVGSGRWVGWMPLAILLCRDGFPPLPDD